MTETKSAVEERPAPTGPTAEDFSQAIEQTMDRQPDEQVRCVRVFDDCYRCNWWIRKTSNDWLSYATASIRKSIFLRATMVADKLVIEDLSRPR
jgi:hypothetical protein